MVDKKEIIRILRRMKLEHGPTVCLGCGHEHSCSVHGCAVINDAIVLLQIGGAKDGNQPQ